MDVPKLTRFPSCPTHFLGSFRGGGGSDLGNFGHKISEINLNRIWNQTKMREIGFGIPQQIVGPENDPFSAVIQIIFWGHLKGSDFAETAILRMVNGWTDFTDFA